MLLQRRERVPALPRAEGKLRCTGEVAYERPPLRSPHTRVRLRAEPFEPYFDGSKKFLPKPSDLAFYNWATQSSTSNSTTQFQVRD